MIARNLDAALSRLHRPHSARVRKFVTIMYCENSVALSIRVISFDAITGQRTHPCLKFWPCLVDSVQPAKDSECVGAVFRRVVLICTIRLSVTRGSPDMIKLPSWKTSASGFPRMSDHLDTPAPPRAASPDTRP